MTSYRPQSVNVNDLVITPLKQNEKNKGSTAYVNHKGGRLRIRTDVMRTPFGASVVNIEDIEKLREKNAPASEVNDAKKFGLSVAIPDENDELRKLVDALDDKLLETAMKEKYVPGMNSVDGYKAVHNRVVKLAIDKKTGEPKPYPPTFRASIPRDYNTKEIRTVVCGRERGSDGKLLPIPVTVDNISDVIPRGAKIRMVLECKSVYQVAGRFGVTWNVVQVQVLEKPAPEDDFEFNDDHDYDLDPSESRTDSGPKVDDSAEVEVADSDGEDEAEDGEEQPEPVATESKSEETVEEDEAPAEESDKEDEEEVESEAEEPEPEPAPVVVAPTPKKAAAKKTPAKKGNASVKNLLSQL